MATAKKSTGKGKFGEPVVSFWAGRNEPMRQMMWKESGDLGDYIQKVKAKWSSMDPEAKDKWIKVHKEVEELCKETENQTGTNSDTPEGKKRLLAMLGGTDAKKQKTDDEQQSAQAQVDKSDPASQATAEGNEGGIDVWIAKEIDQAQQQAQPAETKASPEWCAGCGQVTQHGKYGGGKFESIWYCNTCWDTWPNNQHIKQAEQYGPEAAGSKLQAFPGFQQAHGGKGTRMNKGNFTRVVPKPEDGSTLTDNYVDWLIEENVNKYQRGFMKWEKWLYASDRTPNGVQYKTWDMKATINIYLPGGTMHVAEKAGAGVCDEIWGNVQWWTEEKR